MRAGPLAVLVAVTAAACGGGEPVDPTLVAVAAQPCDRPTRDRGVGVIVAPDVVATAAHVVDGPRRELTVDGAPARVVAVDARTDLALLAADVGGSTAPTTLDALDHGTIHTPGGDHAVDVVRTGRLVVHDVTDDARYEREVHTFRPGVEPGTSGAPLVDEDGRLAGIVVLTNRADGTAYAVTAAELRAVVAASPGSATAVGCPTKVVAAGTAAQAGRLHETFLHSVPGTVGGDRLDRRRLLGRRRRWVH